MHRFIEFAAVDINIYIIKLYLYTMFTVLTVYSSG